MASSDDFREQLKAGNITEALALALSEAVELKITTWVASAEDDVETAEARQGHRLHTRINMIEGDIENEIGDQFIDKGPYTDLRQFHLDQVAEGNRIIQNNLKSLQKLFEVLVTMRYQGTTPPVINPESLGSDSQLLPPAEIVTDTGLVNELPEAGFEDYVSTPTPLVADIPEAELVSELPEAGFEDYVSTPTPLVADIPEAELVREPPEATVEDYVSTPTPLVTDVPEAELVSEPLEAAVEDYVSTPPTGVEEDVAKEPQPSEEPASFLTTPADSQQTLDSETDEDDWDDSVLDLLESLPIMPPPEPADLDSLIDDDWGDLVEDELEPEAATSDSQGNQNWEMLVLEDFDLPPESPEPNLEASNSQIDEDWGDLVEEELEPESAASDLQVNKDERILALQDSEALLTSPEPNLEASNSQIDDDWGDLVEEVEPEPAASDLQVNKDEGILALQDSEALLTSPEPNLEASNSQIDDDWGWEDTVEQEPEPNSERVVPSLESLDLEENDEWDDWVEEESEPLVDAPLADDIESLDLGEDEDWDDLGEDFDPFAAAPALNGSRSDLEIDQDWDDFSTEELEPSSAILDLDTELERPDPLERLTEAESVHYNTDLSDNLKTDSSKEKNPLEELDRFPPMPEMTNQLRDTSSDPIEVLFGDIDTFSRKPEQALPEDKEVSSTQDESEMEALNKDSDPMAMSEDELDDNLKPIDKRVLPPPPPPSRFPNENN